VSEAPEAPPTPAPAPVGETSVYEIEQGDTLTEISRKTGVSVQRLAEANAIIDVNWIYAGSSLVIPPVQ
jgi:LysM repeat protein